MSWIDVHPLGFARCHSITPSSCEPDPFTQKRRGIQLAIQFARGSMPGLCLAAVSDRGLQTWLAVWVKAALLDLELEYFIHQILSKALLIINNQCKRSHQILLLIFFNFPLGYIYIIILYLFIFLFFFWEKLCSLIHYPGIKYRLYDDHLVGHLSSSKLQ